MKTWTVSAPILTTLLTKAFSLNIVRNLELERADQVNRKRSQLVFHANPDQKRRKMEATDFKNARSFRCGLHRLVTSASGFLTTFWAVSSRDSRDVQRILAQGVPVLPRASVI